MAVDNAIPDSVSTASIRRPPGKLTMQLFRSAVEYDGILHRSLKSGVRHAYHKSMLKRPGKLDCDRTIDNTIDIKVAIEAVQFLTMISAD
jgi:hypothetical protein